MLEGSYCCYTSYLIQIDKSPGGAYLVGLKVEGKAWTYRKVMLMR